MIRFTDLKPGDKAIIVQAEPDCDFCRRLMEMGLVVGTEVKVVKVAPLGDPVEIEIRGSRLCIRKTEMHCFELKRI